MGMCVDLKVGESLVAYRKGDEKFSIRIVLEKKLGSSTARLVFEAAEEIILLPPKMQHKLTVL
jgi:hypothetical protein